MAGLVADSGTLWVGPIGSTALTKANFATAIGTIDSDYKNIGDLAKNGISLASDPTIVELFKFGSLDPSRTRKTREIKRFTARLQDWNTASFTTAFNGGTVTVTSGVAEYIPVDDTELVPHIIIWEFEDGTYTYRLVFENTEVRSGTSMDFSDEAFTELPLDVTVLKPVSGPSWRLLTDNPLFVAT